MSTSYMERESRYLFQQREIFVLKINTKLVSAVRLLLVEIFLQLTKLVLIHHNPEWKPVLVLQKCHALLQIYINKPDDIYQEQ